MTSPQTPPFTVMPLRYSDDPKRMINFLRTLGLAEIVTTDGDGFAELRAGAGRVMVHTAKGSDTGATSGTTDLCLSVASLDDVVATLRGLEVRVWDESYGRQAVVTGPLGETVSLNEQQRDLYGYRGHDGSGADARLTVTAVRPSPDFATDTGYFDQFGFVADPDGNQWWQALRGPGAAGVVGLHRPNEGDHARRETDSAFGAPATVRLGFETTEDLDELAARLAAAGHPAEVVAEHGLRAVHLTDPDGEHLEIHSA
ncbi:hypothetical protein ACQCX2_13125 [Propionibacteriaceae bacterium Y1700]|uniref:hypothetical protein n=1 Tax=Microlunatus sp. Y1700 TaxID=3418487 RepID=UPI003DA76710